MLLIVYYVIFMIAGDLSAYLIGEDVDLMETINDLDNQHGLRLHRPFHL